MGWDGTLVRWSQPFASKGDTFFSKKLATEAQKEFRVPQIRINLYHPNTIHPTKTQLVQQDRTFCGDSVGFTVTMRHLTPNSWGRWKFTMASMVHEKR